MKRLVFSCALAAFLLSICLLACFTFLLISPEPKVKAKKYPETSAAVEALGGRFESVGMYILYEMTSYPYRYQSVTLKDTACSDMDLERLKVLLEQLDNLTSLNLENTRVTDLGMVNLKQLTELQVLNLSGTQVTDSGVADIKKALPRCTVTNNSQEKN